MPLNVSNNGNYRFYRHIETMIAMPHLVNITKDFTTHFSVHAMYNILDTVARWLESLTLDQRILSSSPNMAAQQQFSHIF